MALRRGFKAEAERSALELRERLNLHKDAPVEIGTVAELLGATVVDASELVDRRRLEEIESIQSFAFSACTFEIDGRHFIVVNPLRSPERQVSDVAHELAHLALGHELSEIRELDGVPFRTCDARQEEEATYLGATILLPRPLLLLEARKEATPETIAREFGVTRELASFRFNTTGVARQVERERQQGR
ncbi:MAG: ImmA/IrrE family metallo-endopeptidase [Acidobacteria bacterium]|nr:ImmA/IrrE family metallo-endopeptidase [Acidobacteriota bacterium]